MKKVLLDTDIGTDVDDAVALAYLLSHPDCELVGITTVTGEAHKRASLASVLCRVAGRDIPIYPGADHPMQGKQRQLIAQQAAVLRHWPHKTDFPAGQAVEFMANTIRSHPGEVTLLTIGPLTNVGSLFSAHHDIPSLLGALVTMGGSYGQDLSHTEPVEWNIAGDPVASEITYRAAVRLHRSVGLNVTQQVVMPADEVRGRFTTPLLRPVLDMAEIWFSQFYPFITFHDPLAAATIFEPDVCSYQGGTARAEATDAATRIIWQPGGSHALHQVAVTVDVQRYFHHFFSVVG